MGDCPPYYKSVSENVGGFCESSKETPVCAFGYIEGLSINDLCCHFTDYLNIQGGEDSNNKCNSETVKEDVTKDSYGSDSGKVASVKYSIKCATFPCSGMSVPPAEIGGEERKENVTAEVMTHGADAKSPDLSYSRSVSLPVSFLCLTMFSIRFFFLVY